jgi:hypothetical protein
VIRSRKLASIAFPFARRFGAVLAVVLNVAPAQRIPTSTAEPSPEVASAELAAARDALTNAKRADAVKALSAALAERPFDLSCLRDLLLATDDGDARLLWGEQWRSAAGDVEGKSSPDPATTKALGDDKVTAALVVARAAAARELTRLIKAQKEGAAKAMRSGVGARRAAALAWALLRTSPALVAAHGKEADESLGVFTPDPRPVLAALEAVIDAGAHTEHPDLALRAAQILVGLGRQAAFPDLRGPKPPDVKASADAGRRAVDAIRAAKAKSAKAWAVEELNTLTAEERAAFTREHASWSDPGVATSPQGLYRVETTCGFETLRGVAETIELHHARLASWCGVDPFKGRQGIVRVVPEPSGLEDEGSPFWWAGGFQSGDVTTVVFSAGDVEGLGHGLTHELTHRFDGALYPYLPAWLAEGRAVWTGAAYASTLDLGFSKRHASFGTIEDAFIKGYGDPTNLTHLVEGTLKEYRHNYPAGYALWMYLNTWEEGGKRVFGPKLDGFLKGLIKGRNRPKDWFVASFCDGRDGRPKTFEDFAAGFAAFLKGFYWQSRAPWTDRYTHDAGKHKASPWVYDRPTWHGGRSRAEPWFGQDQARLAGDVLWDAGRRKEALLAYAWALEVDEWSGAAAARFATLCDEQGLKDLAWAARAEDRRLRPEAAAAPGPAPYLGSLVKTQALLKAWRDAAEAAKKQGLAVAAAAIAADHDRFASSLGLPPLQWTAPLERIDACAHPFDEPARPLGLHGWQEDGLTDYEERRVADLWFATPDGDLHVGRVKPREGTGAPDRGLWQRDAFTRTKEWVPGGRYVVEGRIFFTTSYFSGAVTVGWRRADRVARFQFTGGDYLYSAGVNQQPAKLDSIDWHLHGRRTRDGGLWGSAPGGRFKFPGERGSFRFALLVDGPEVHAFVDDRWVGTYADAEGLPIEGHVGFASSFGAVQVQRPSVRRLDRGRLSGLRRLREDGLDVAVDGGLSGDALRNRRVHGVSVGPRGALLVWIAPPAKPFESPEEESFDFDGVLEVARHLPGVLNRENAAQGVIVALSDFYSDERLAQFKSALKDHGASAEVSVIRHRRKRPLLTYGVEGRPPAPVPTLIFVDPQGFYRAHADFVGKPDELPEPVRHWARAF